MIKAAQAHKEIIKYTTLTVLLFDLELGFSTFTRYVTNCIKGPNEFKVSKIVQKCLTKVSFWDSEAVRAIF